MDEDRKMEDLRGRLREANRQLQRKDEQLARAEAKQGSEHAEKLIGWLEELDAGVSVVLGSRRWKIGNFIGDLGQGTLPGRWEPEVAASIRQTLKRFRAWKRRTRRRASAGEKATSSETSPRNANPLEAGRGARAEGISVNRHSPKSPVRGESPKRIHGPLRIVHERDAYVTPFTYDRKTSSGYGCIYDSNLKRIDESLRTGKVVRVKSADPLHLQTPDDAFRRWPGEAVYLGHLIGQYGHFLTETLSAFWALQYMEDREILFHPFIFGRETRAFMEPFFEAFGIDVKRIHIIGEPLKLESVLIPERTFHVNDRVHEWYIEIIRKVSDRMCPGPANRTRRIFLSRSLLEGNKRQIANHEEIDAAMESLGFEVIHPQTMPIMDQVRLYKNTSVMAGFSGSALHNSVFLDSRSALIEFGDLRTHSKPLPNQVLCDLASGCRSFYTPFRQDERYATEKEKGASRADCRYLQERMEGVLELL